MGIQSQAGLLSGGGLVSRLGLSSGAGFFTPGSGGGDPLAASYYFFDPQTLSDGPVSTWNGRVEGSSNGDIDLFITQSNGSNQPVKSGNYVRFNDSGDHFDVPSGFIEPASGSWQIVGTDEGVFYYKVDGASVNDLSRMGNRGASSSRQAGDLYGLMLIAVDSTQADIDAARDLLIGRGATENGTDTSLYRYWYNRDDIIEFGAASITDAQTLSQCWRNCSGMTIFPPNVFDSWNPSSISDNPFSSTWDGCSSMFASSVENILVSIDASGQHPTSDGTATGTLRPNRTIFIDYDAGSGSLTSETTAAIASLKSKNWSVSINNFIQ